MRFLRMAVVAAMAAGAGLWAGGASATTINVTPQGPNHFVDSGFAVNKASDFSVTVVFDSDAYKQLAGSYEYELAFFVSQPCANPANTGCYYAETNPGAGLFDFQSPGQTTYWGSAYPQITWAPIDHGFTLNYYANSMCLPMAEGSFCHELKSIDVMYVSGYVSSDQPFSYDVTFGDAAPRGVPEPATWAMMILGFGLVGGALRRRAAVAA
jgi:hypothetical protein